LADMMFGREVSPTSKMSEIKNINGVFWSYRVILFIDVIVVSVSSLVFCFMDNNAAVVNHEMCLYGMPFPLA
jgi:hypothetical protein